MPRIEFDLESTLPPEKVVDLFTDFSPQRPQTWPGLSPQQYEVYSVGPTSADVKEGGPSQFWAKEHYDWSTPGKVRWQVAESNFCTPGSYVEATVKPGADGGSSVHFQWERQPSSLMGRIAFIALSLTGGSAIKSSFQKGLEKAEAEATQD